MNAIAKILPIFLLIFTAVFIVKFSHFVFGKSSGIDISFQTLEIRYGAGLYKKELSNENEAYLQIIDVGKMQIDQIIGEVDKMNLLRRVGAIALRATLFQEMAFLGQIGMRRGEESPDLTVLQEKQFCHRSITMKTDTIFYSLFQEFFSILFELINQYLHNRMWLLLLYF